MRLRTQRISGGAGKSQGSFLPSQCATTERPRDPKLMHVISIRLSSDDIEQLDDVATRILVDGLVPRLTLARIALQLGLEMIRKNPAMALLSGQEGDE